MDSTPPRKSDTRRSRSQPRHARFFNDCVENVQRNLTPSPKKSLSPIDFSLQQYPRPCSSSPNSFPIRDLLVLSPSPLGKSKQGHKIEINPSIPENLALEEPVEPVNVRRKCRSRSSSSGLVCCSSPKNACRARRRLEQESREERDLGLGEENCKARKRRHSRPTTRREKKNGLILLPPSGISPISPNSEIVNGDLNSLDCVRHLILELILWKDVAKTSLWFGFGSLCFLSSCFTKGINFSFISGISHLGLLFLAMAFFCKTFAHREKEEPKQNFKLTEDDLIRAGRFILPAANAVISAIRELFSGEPTMTLKMVPVLLFASEYGHLITLWRLAASGFFISFSIPKLYSCYSEKIHKQVDFLRSWVWETWEACSHKRIVAVTAATGFWNLSSVKTRIFAAFVIMVAFQYYRQCPVAGEGEGEQQELVVAVEEEASELIANHKKEDILVASEVQKGLEKKHQN